MSSATLSPTMLSPGTPSLQMATMVDVGKPQNLTVVHVSTTLVALQHWRKPEQDCGSELATFDITTAWVSNLCSRSPYSRTLATHTRAPTTSLHPLTPAIPISNPDDGNKDCSGWLTIGLPIILVIATILGIWRYIRQAAIRRHYQRRPLEEHKMVNSNTNVPPLGASGDASQKITNVEPVQKVASGVSHPDTASGHENLKKKKMKKTMKKDAPSQPPPSQPPSTNSSSSKNSSSEKTSDKDSSTTTSNSSAERRKQAQNAARQIPPMANKRRGNPTIRPVASDQPSFPPRAARRNATVADEGSLSPRGTFSSPSGRRNAMSDEPQSPRGTSGGIDWNTTIFGN